MKDVYDLERFLAAQERVYEQALAETKRGLKQSHWMWFVFPQIAGLGHSDTARRYAVKSLEEANAYLAHPVLGKRLVEIANALLTHKTKTALEIFGHPDDLKLKSCMTLFHRAVGDANSVFKQVLDTYFDGKEDAATLDILNR